MTRRKAAMFRLPDLAQYLGVTVAEVEAMIDQGLIATVGPSDLVRVHEADLHEYLQARSERAQQKVTRTRRGLRLLRNDRSAI